MSTTEPFRGPQVRRLQIFLCHSSEDKPFVRELSRRLREDGFDPWLDEEQLLPGQDWHEEIRGALNSCNVALICLSHHSVNKEGFLQREIRDALYVAEEKPEGTIFVIPVRIEDQVPVPHRLSRWQWANAFDAEGYERLRRALAIRAGQIEEREPVFKPQPPERVEISRSEVRRKNQLRTAVAAALRGPDPDLPGCVYESFYGPRPDLPWWKQIFLEASTFWGSLLVGFAWASMMSTVLRLEPELNYLLPAAFYADGLALGFAVKLFRPGISWKRTFALFAAWSLATTVYLCFSYYYSVRLGNWVANIVSNPEAPRSFLVPRFVTWSAIRLVYRLVAGAASGLLITRRFRNRGWQSLAAGLAFAIFPAVFILAVLGFSVPKGIPFYMYVAFSEFLGGSLGGWAILSMIRRSDQRVPLVEPVPASRHARP